MFLFFSFLNHLAYILDVEGKDRYKLFIKDLVSNKQLIEIDNVVSAEWVSNNSIVYTSADQLYRPFQVCFFYFIFFIYYFQFQFHFQKGKTTFSWNFRIK